MAVEWRFYVYYNSLGEYMIIKYSYYLLAAPITNYIL